MTNYLFAFVGSEDTPKLAPGVMLCVVIPRREVNGAQGENLDTKLSKMPLKVVDKDKRVLVGYGEYHSAEVTREKVYASYTITKINKNGAH